MFEREIINIKVKKDIVCRTANNLAETFENLEIKCEIIKNGTKINGLSLIGLLKR
jgi:phosphotransferase system HPr-like phosphotransfer protein